MSTITFSTCWYQLKAKFDASVYHSWIHNMLCNVNQYFLVIYTDENSCQVLQQYADNPRIKIVKKEFTELYYYKYKPQWEENHSRNYLLNNRVDWRVNALWAEKTQFVFDTMINKYFDTEFYGWCDIGYFRARNNYDLSIEDLKNWPNPQKIAELSKNHIYYACVNNDEWYMQDLVNIIQERDSGTTLPKSPIPDNQTSIAGGFFVCHSSLVEWWKSTFESRLLIYFHHGRLVKDDQIIVVDCIFSYLKMFVLCKENTQYDNWFLFQRFLL
jgi:hypothetical protein